MATFKTIGIVGIHRNPLVFETVQHLLELLPKWDYQVLVETDTAAQPGCKIKGASLEALSKSCDLVIAVGGDGNLLRVSRILSKANKPVIGIHRGNLGFLTDIDPQELETTLKPMLQGRYVKESRFLIEGQINENSWDNALNDIVLFAGEAAQLITFEVFINDQFVYSFELLFHFI